MINSRFNRLFRLGIPFLFGMLLIVNCQTQSRSSGGGGSSGGSGGAGGSGCASPNSSYQARSPKAIGGTVRESRNSIVTSVSDVAVTIIIQRPDPNGLEPPRVLDVVTVKTNTNGDFRLELDPQAREVVIRPSKEGHSFDPEVFRGPLGQLVNFTASRLSI